MLPPSQFRNSHSLQSRFVNLRGTDLAILQRFTEIERLGPLLRTTSRQPCAPALAQQSPDCCASYHSFVDSYGPQAATVVHVNIPLTYEQSARLELIALHAGKSTAQTLIDAAHFLLACDAGDSAPDASSQSQHFLSDRELEVRFQKLLHPSS